MKTLICIFILFISTYSYSTIINVPADQPTIQDGIIAAVNSDTVLVQPGTYVENINFNSKDITVASLFLTTQDPIYILQTIIDGNQSGGVVEFVNGETQAALLCGFTITNGYSSTSGGGISCVYTSNPRLENLVITGNSAEYNGGGIICGAFANPSLENVTITNNSSGGSGGGIFCYNYCNPSLENVIISNNTSNQGGGICLLESCSPILDGVIISNNSVNGDGGGIFSGINSNPNLLSVNITENTATNGGGIFIIESTPNLEFVNIIGNSAVEGGGIYLEDSGSTLLSTTITGNSAVTGGGGLYCNSSNPLLYDVTLSGNSTEGAGGGICCQGSSPVLQNVTISGNSANEIGGGLFCILFSDPSLVNVIISDNAVLNADGWGGGICCLTHSSPNLENVTISNNSADAGGGILCVDSSNPTLENVIITGNSAHAGGGINCGANSNPELIDVLINENTATAFGGGISCVESAPNLLNVIILENTSNKGGGIHCQYNSSLNMENVTVTQNTAGNSGGGIYAEYSNLQFENCDFTENFAQGNHGGAIQYWNYGDPLYTGIEYQIEFTNCNFSSNTALFKYGGVGLGKDTDDLSIMNVTIDECEFVNNMADNYCGLRLFGNSLTFSVLNCIFSGNEAINYSAAGGFSGNCIGEIFNCLIFNNTAATGGGDWNSGGFVVWNEASVNFVNCTFVENSAAYGAGLTVGGGGEATITNCILWGNSSDQIGFGEWNDLGGTLTVNYCDIQNGVDSIYVTPLSILDWGDGNIDDDPLFIGSGDHPFSLQDISTCVNTGIPDTTGLNLPEFDLAGNPRMYGGRIEMGAYENQNVVSSEENIIPQITNLKQNYPNPFNPETTISYQLQENSKVEISVYNLKGQKVKQLVSDQLLAGQHFVVWNGRDGNDKSVSSGIYFYKMKTNNYEETKRMILMK